MWDMCRCPGFRFIVVKSPFLQPSCFLANLEGASRSSAEPIPHEIQYLPKYIKAGDTVGEKFVNNFQVHRCGVGKRERVPSGFRKLFSGECDGFVTSLPASGVLQGPQRENRG